MYEKIIEIISKRLKLDKEIITPDSNIMDNLGADSLDIVEIAMTLEREFDISISDEDIVNFKTPDDILKFLEKNKVVSR